VLTGELGAPILAPLVGLDRARAQVVAEVDYSVVETTEELYEPRPEAVRSEEVSEQRTEGSSLPAGIPGALSNQPPPAATTDPEAAPGQIPGTPVSTSRDVRRNYELYRTIRHVRSPAGKLRRLSVAVVIDDVVGLDENGQPVREPLDDAELEELTRLIKEAVGFDARRGDSVQVVNASFRGVEPPAEAESVPLWQEPWFMDALKLVAGALALLALLLGVLRPVLRTLATHGALPAPEEGGDDGQGKQALAGSGPAGEKAGLPAPEDGLAEDQVSLSSDQGAPARLSGPAPYEEALERVQALAGGDPRLAARIVKDWVAEHA
jgi:flagellar M-ring protein FliF